jgi:hypothetical protein
MSNEIKSSHKPKVIISKELAAQIQYTHNKCPLNKEWSGLLIYQVLKGSLTDLANLEIKCHALFPMDFGDATFTSFEGDQSWITCFQQFPQINPINPTEGWYIGKLHDHPNFNVFHSGTDKSDLYSTAPKLPMYLSLIVNYATETDCELAIALEGEETTKWKFKGQEKYDVKVKNSNATYVMKCDVEYEQEDWFIEQIKYIKNKPKTTSFIPKVDTKPDTAGATGTASKVSVNRYTQETVEEELTDLFTLGEGYGHESFVAMNKVGDALSIKERDDYKKAVKVYFCDDWFDTNFYNVRADEDEVIQAILNYLEQYKGWIVTILREIFNELKTEHTKLREIQGSNLV